MTKVRFAILGFGHHATRRLVPAFTRSSQATLVGLWRRDPVAASRDAELHQVRSYESAEALCAAPEVDAVFVTSPDAMHLADAQLAFAHGKAVLCEKPLAMNSDEAEAMQTAAIKADLLFGVAQNFRFNESLEFLRKQIAGGLIGTPQMAHAQFAYFGNRAPRKWITDSGLACGGPIADVGVHCVDALRFILATDVKTVSVLARKDRDSGEMEAFSTMQLEMANGSFANVTTSARSPYRTLVEVTGSEGVFIAENGFSVDQTVDVVLRREGKLVNTITLSNQDGYVRMIDAFADAYRHKTGFSPSGRDGVVNQRILDAAFRSWHLGQRETV